MGAVFESDVEIIRLGNGSVKKFENGRYEAVDQSEALYLRNHPLVTEVTEDDSSSDDSGDSGSGGSTDYQELVARAKELDIDTQGKSKDELAAEIEAEEETLNSLT